MQKMKLGLAVALAACILSGCGKGAEYKYRAGYAAAGADGLQWSNRKL